MTIHQMLLGGSQKQFYSMTGGTESISGGYKTHVFTASGTLTVVQKGEEALIEYVFVSGGGGGSRGGGGGGGYVHDTGAFADIGNYTITVGGGGACAPAGTWSPGSNGSDTTIAVSGGAVFGGPRGGGGGGGIGDAGVNPWDALGQAGGSGGGGGANNNSSSAAVGGAGGVVEGYDGGSGAWDDGMGESQSGSGGGGGATAVGGNGSSNVGWNGGAGANINFDMSRNVCGGGGAFGYAGVGGATHGGGAGSLASTGGNGTVNTGGGGGGAEGNIGRTGGNGGSGLFMCRYPIA